MAVVTSGPESARVFERRRRVLFCLRLPRTSSVLLCAISIFLAESCQRPASFAERAAIILVSSGRSEAGARSAGGADRAGKAERC